MLNRLRTWLRSPALPLYRRQNALSFWDLPVLFKDVAAGLVFIRNRPKLLRAFAFLLVTQVSLGVVVSLAPGFALTVLHIDLEDASLVMILPAAGGMILGAVLLAHGFLSKLRTLLPFYGWLLISFILLIIYPLVRFLPFPYLASFLLFILGMGNSLVDVPSQTVLQEQADDSVRGRVYGILGSFVTAGATLPVLLTTALADVFGVGSVLIAVGLLGLGLGGILERAFAREVGLTFDL